MKIWHKHPKVKQPKRKINKEADCAKCKYATESLDKDYDFVCVAKEYDVKTLACFERKEG